MKKSLNVILISRKQKGGKMGVKVKLMDIIDDIDFQTDYDQSYLNIKTGKVVRISDEEFSYAEGEDDDLDYIPEWQEENIEIAKQILNTDDFIKLPDKFDLDEYRLMEKFSLSQPDERVREDIYYGIKGRGAFRRFKDKIYHYGIADQWFEYRASEIRELAIFWCEQNNIEYYE